MTSSQTNKSNAMSDPNTTLDTAFAEGELEELTARLRSLFDIEDRDFGFPKKTTYPKCFVGSSRPSHWRRTLSPSIGHGSTRQ